MANTMEFYAVYQWLHTKDGKRYVYLDDVACATYEEMLKEALAALDRNELIEVHHRKADGTVEVLSEDHIWCISEEIEQDAIDEAAHERGLRSLEVTGRI